jgi:hypothetical protein
MVRDTRLTSIYTASREDLYDFRRCPKIVAIKAYKTLRTCREDSFAEPATRVLEPAVIGSIGEAAVELSFSAVPASIAIQRIAAKIPQVNVSDHLRQIAIESLAGVKLIRQVG